MAQTEIFMIFFLLVLHTKKKLGDGGPFQHPFKQSRYARKVFPPPSSFLFEY
jgi:hypothetical protein